MHITENKLNKKIPLQGAGFTIVIRVIELLFFDFFKSITEVTKSVIDSGCYDIC